MNINFDKIYDQIPAEIFKLDHQLKQAGFESFLVGGCVRDLILGKKPKDFDITTNAKPKEIAKVFPESVTTYAKFGTVLVLVKDQNGEVQPVEVTTYRSEMDYVDGRWPTKVEFANKLSQDLGRRDYTINAMALMLNPLEEREDKLIDLFGGISDLRKRVIRAVGTPRSRLAEDGLRGFRACRLAAVLGFEIESETFEAIENTLEIAAQISIERVRDEFMRLLLEAPKPSIGIELLRKTGLLKLFLPELLEGIGVNQPEYHIHDVYYHSLACLNAASDKVKLAALFHDIGKPRAKNVKFEEKYLKKLKEKGKPIPAHHFFGHDAESAKMAQEIMTRMKFPKAEIERVTRLVRWHMFFYQNQWSDGAVRRFINRVGGEEYVDQLFELRIADADSNPKSEFSPSEIQKLQSRIAQVRKADMALKVADLNINGNDLKQIGILQGPKMGKILNSLLELVLDDPGFNTKEKLLHKAKELLQSAKQ
ncbi:poly(A) polymerase [candidate division WWE3 bacterium CG06_land_8_20_14_3_00_42_16]|uniref:Poly(A) polymerase n=4 Tax=Katanobacteria TaxID=422282 RepID=A0A2M7AP16_UNCKA|nr:MAG: poly(A) polymerase [candidate division WWE3 bacterium CG06_land_8_20_14_3_00_42_16]PIZ43314.1 MAG: poly(A) polymerase [candidate division WWE3 bacterium CG_4_10_14_0_2_um_filter_42_8]PJA38581.1 MAG: poly(A) polymerase [candidate division WWE3 bacterium CG_4_9_14_3_um_filter_43_9]PJC69464.1 MAG: poly(A) polymerase [candidate division WWE3 bacterium CG_4_8_14_3_um_filter_42_11]